MKNTETKFYESGLDNMQLYHNKGFGTLLLPPAVVSSIPFLFNFWSNITPGSGRDQRIGDKITPRGMVLDMFIANKFDRPNTKVRIMVCTVPKEYNGTVTTSSNFDPFQNTGTGNRLILAPDHDKGVKVLYDKVKNVCSNQAIGAGYPEFNAGTIREGTTVVKLWIKRKNAKPIIFNQALQQIVNRPIAVYIIPYEQFSTLETDRVASVSARCRIYYKDM